MPFADAFELAALIDHTLLKPEATESDIDTLCRQAVDHRFASVCINPYWVPLASSHVAGSPVRVCSVIGFPLGANQTAIKIAEARLAVEQGASEIDMVINIGAFRSGIDPEPEIRQIAEAVHSSEAILKVILETCLFTTGQIFSACEAAQRAGADFVKTSTGFSTAGATEENVSLMRRTVGPGIGVKASGGIRSLDSLSRMVAAGASRIGTSSGVQIIAQFHSGSANSADAGGGY